MAGQESGKISMANQSFVGKLIQRRSEMGAIVELEEDLRRWVLQKIRQGFTVEQISLALAEQKVELMQADVYVKAINEERGRP
jgi:hypothetical protein